MEFDWKNVGLGMCVIYALPFVVILLAIAVLPLIRPLAHWWEHNRNKLIVAVLCAVAGMLMYLLPTGDFSKIAMTYLEYAAFLTMLAALFVISGGIHISGSFAGFPLTNALILGIGTILASCLGTTGASMILIRPLLSANRLRQRKVHIVIFFIFMVSNCGGLLTPLGDPPLYLGFLRGVPFTWTLKLMPEWLVTNALLLALFCIMDFICYFRESRETRDALRQVTRQAGHKLRIQGLHNFLFLMGVMGSIIAASVWVYPAAMARGGEHAAEIWSKLFQIALMALLAICSHLVTSNKIRRENNFTFLPIQEVGILFFGIFGAMIPALTLLDAKSSMLALREPWQYFWMTGLLSSFLDNAPTYLAYVTLAASQQGVSTLHLGELAAGFPALLTAVSCGAVFMGASTYIGNGPNFMVKSIAEHEKIRMPSFGGYMVWAGLILIPIFILQTWLFF